MGKRRRAREMALTLIYQMEIKDEWMLKGVLKNKDKIDNLITKFSENWSFDRISIIDKSILRMAISELYMATPKTAVINEALELAEKYGEQDSKSFINGLLDTISCNL